MLKDSLSLALLQNQFAYQDPTFSMEDMLATLPRVVSAPPVSGGCHPAQDHLATGGQMGGAFGLGKQEDPRCNGTLRKQASPRSNALTTSTAPAAGLGSGTTNTFSLLVMRATEYYCSHYRPKFIEAKIFSPSHLWKYILSYRYQNGTSQRYDKSCGSRRIASALAAPAFAEPR